jgi:hypothetical protein
VSPLYLWPLHFILVAVCVRHHGDTMFLKLLWKIKQFINLSKTHAYSVDNIGQLQSKRQPMVVGILGAVFFIKLSIDK